MVDGQLITEFSYMVEEGEDDMPAIEEHDVLSVAVPLNFAVIDTGCTTSMIGSETAAEYKAFFCSSGYPEPTALTLPPVQLKGFNGVRSSTNQGLRWTVKLGNLWGTILSFCPVSLGKQAMVISFCRWFLRRSPSMPSRFGRLSLGGSSHPLLLL